MRENIVLYIVIMRILQFTKRSVAGTLNVCRKLLEALRTFSSVDISSVPASTVDVLIAAMFTISREKRCSYTSSCDNRVDFGEYKGFLFTIVEHIQRIT